MPKPRLTRPQQEVVDVLAHWFVVADMAANIEGLSGFATHYEQNVMTPKQRLILDQFKNRVPQIRRDMRRLLEAEQNQERADDGAP